MFSFNSLRNGRSVLVLLVVFVLSMALFIGCDSDDNSYVVYGLNPDLIGTWEDTTYSDGYTITDSHLTYFGNVSSNTISSGGKIRYVANYTDEAGVIIIEYDSDKKAKYYDDWDPETYEPVGDPLPLNGNFIGVYYKDLKPGVSVSMSNALEADYSAAEVATLDEAILKFTMGMADTYVSWWGGPYALND